MLEWRFLHPWFLALLPLPLIWLAWHTLSRRRRHPSVVYSDIAVVAQGIRTWRIRALGAMPWVRALALILGILALARPQYGSVQRQQSALGVDIALALDVSQSMDAWDFQPTRLEAAKHVMKEFVRSREHDRMSVVIFGSFAAVLVPPTFDRMAIEMYLDSVNSELLDRNQRRTAMGDGLALAVSKLADSEAKSRVAILLADGENNAGRIDPAQAAEAAKALGVRVYTIGVGSNTQLSTSDGFIISRPIEFSMDERSLKEVAEMTGGRYFRASNTDALRRIYEEIDRMERTEIEVNEFDDFDERFAWLWLPGLALIGLEFLLRAFVLVRLP